MPLDLSRDRVVLLFFKDYERDVFFKGDRHLKRLVRPVYNMFNRGPKVSGFLVWHQLLVRALQEYGYQVEVNNYKLARQNPHYPVGLVGYPSLLENWQLPNPALLGPALFDHPQIAPNLLDDPRYKRYILTCDWMYDLFKPVYGEKCVRWHAGIDLERWSDTRNHPKTIDMLIYDKIRWNRDEYEPHFIQPIIEQLKARNLSYHVLRYRTYDYPEYAQLLKNSRSMLFLCEHETQGMAYQEAMSSNVPVLAWDQGFWLDPQRLKYTSEPIPTSSVPFFSELCGERFTSLEDFSPMLDQFWSRLSHYQPRTYVQNQLSPSLSAQKYIEAYNQCVTKDTEKPI